MFAALCKLDAFTVAGLARLDELQQEVGLLGRPHGLVQVDVPARPSEISKDVDAVEASNNNDKLQLF